MNILAFLLLGLALGWPFARWSRLLRWSHYATNIAIYLLVFLLGLAIGGNAPLWAALPRLGGQAAWLSLGAIMGSLLFCQPLTHLFLRKGVGAEQGETASAQGQFDLAPFVGSLIILLFFVGGAGAGRLAWLPAAAQDARLTLYVLYGLLFLIGFGLGGGRQLGSILRQTSWRILLVPLAVALGSLAGAGLFSLLLRDISLAEGAAVGAGLGYYSLSSILIGQLRGETLAAVALLSNILREIGTLLLAPLLARYLGRLAPVAAGGATAMDTTLPVIVQVSGEGYGVIAIVSGILLTTAVPILVTLLLR
jgi:uncharacterized membrane protein YbjE (DUF340 family)